MKQIGCLSPTEFPLLLQKNFKVNILGTKLPKVRQRSPVALLPSPCSATQFSICMESLLANRNELISALGNYLQCDKPAKTCPPGNYLDTQNDQCQGCFVS